MRVIRFQRRIPGTGGDVLPLGTAVEKADGWWFVPFNQNTHGPSRKAHVSWEKCLPRWVGYPDYCESEEITR